jgi:glycosyltransferase involved in cell wall biosynthesis
VFVLAVVIEKNLVVGIDATNLRQGGGRTHLIEFLRVAKPERFGVNKVIIWGGSETLSLIDNKPWLYKFSPDLLNKGFLFRTFWQRFMLSAAAHSEKCDILLIPGGSFSGNFQNVVTISQNLLPFEWGELKRYGLSLLTAKLILLRIVQTSSFRRSRGVIFLSEYALRTVLQIVSPMVGEVAIVPHGFNRRFVIAPRPQSHIEEYTKSVPYRVLYVSIIDKYKHQCSVVEGIALLRERGFPVILELVGPAYAPALKRLNEVIDRVNPQRDWVHYLGSIPFNELHHCYARADLGVFASSCENLPNILIEMMAAGLPIACSNRGPMPEVLGDAGVYFDPESAEEIAQTLEHFISNPQLRKQKAWMSFETVKQYSWERCADDTFEFLARVSR